MNENREEAHEPILAVDCADVELNRREEEALEDNVRSSNSNESWKSSEDTITT